MMNITYPPPEKSRLPLKDALLLLKFQRDEGSSLIGDMDPKHLTAWLNQTQKILNEIFSVEVISQKLKFESQPDYEILNQYLDLINEYIGKIERQLEDTEQNQNAKKIDNKKVFIVHGHDEKIKTNVEEFLISIGLEPIILHKQADLGKTIIEKVEYYSDVGFTIILLTREDVGTKYIGYVPVAKNPTKKDIIAANRRTNDATLKNIRWRARQNVIFEFGYFIGKLGRNRVAALCEEGIERPSDIDGLLYTPLDSRGVWMKKLAREIDAAGIKIDEKYL